MAQVMVMELNPPSENERKFGEIVAEIWAILDRVKRTNEHTYDGLMRRRELLTQANVLWAIAIEVAREGMSHDVHSASR